MAMHSFFQHSVLICESRHFTRAAVTRLNTRNYHEVRWRHYKWESLQANMTSKHARPADSGWPWQPC